MNEYLNNPPMPGALGGGGSGGHELSALGGNGCSHEHPLFNRQDLIEPKHVVVEKPEEARDQDLLAALTKNETKNWKMSYTLFLPKGEGGLQSLLGNMSHNQLMQLIGPTGLEGIGRYHLKGELQSQ